MIFLEYIGLKNGSGDFVLKSQWEFKDLVIALVGESQADFLETSRMCRSVVPLTRLQIASSKLKNYFQDFWK